MPTPEEIQAKLDAKRAGTPAPTGRNVNEAPLPSGSVKAGTSGNSKVSPPKARKTRAEARQESVDVVKETFSNLFSGRSFLKEVFGKDISGLPDPIEEFVDLVANPSTLLTAGIGSGVKVPVKLASKAPAIGKALASPLGRLAWRVSTDAAVGAAGGAVAQETVERLPEGTPQWAKVAAGLGASIATQSAATGGINRSLRSVSADLSKKQVADEAASWARAEGRQYMAGLRDMDDLIDDFNTIEPRALREFAGRMGIDPVVLENTDAGRGMHAWARNRALADPAAEIAVKKALPTQLNAFRLDGSELANVPKAKGKHWHDVFSDAEAPRRYDFDERQTQQWQAMHDLLRETEAFNARYGRDVPLLEQDGKWYVPRIAKGTDLGDFERPRDQRLSRLYEDAVEGQKAGIDYEDPMQAVMLHVKSAYRGAADQMFEDYIDRFAVAPGAAYGASARGGAMNAKWRAAVDAYRKADRVEGVRVRRLQNLTARLSEARRTNKHPMRVKNLEMKVDEAKVELAASRRNLDAARKAKATQKSALVNDMKHFKKSGSTKIPSKLFGRNGDELINARLWKGKFIPTEDFNRLVKWFDPMTGAPVQRTPGIIVDGIEKVNNGLRTAASVGDFAMPFLQGLPLLAKDPVAWSKMAARHYYAFLDPGTQNRYIAQNADEIQQMVIQSRIPPGDTEMFTSMRPLSAAGTLRKQTVGRFEASYNTGLLIARHMLWKSLMQSGAGSPEQVGKMVRSMTGGLDTKALGIGAGARALESMAVFSPKLFRSSIALFASAAQPWTPAGAQAAHTLLRMTAATAGLFSLAAIAAGNAAGESEEEINQRVRDTLNPLAGKKFMAVKVGDDWYGAGGQVRAITQFLANAMAGGLSVASDGKLTDGLDDVETNPIVSLLNLLQTRASPAVHAAESVAEYATGEKNNFLPFDEIDDVPSLLEYNAKSGAPFLIQAALEMGEDPFQSPFEVGALPALAANLGGIRQSGITPFERRNELSIEETGYHYRDLTVDEKREFRERHPDLQKVADEFGDLADKQYRQERDEINATATETLRQMAITLEETGKPGDIRVFRENVEKVMAARSSRLDQIRSTLGQDENEGADTLSGRALDAYFKTFQDASFNPDDPDSPIDFETLDQLQATLDREIDNEVYGPPDQVREAIAERTSFVMPPELAWYEANKQIIRDAGYWDAKDRAFNALKERIQQTPGFEGVESAGEIGARRVIAMRTGDAATEARARAIMNQIDKISGQEHERQRRQNPALDRALLQNGYTTKRLTRD